MGKSFWECQHCGQLLWMAYRPYRCPSCETWDPPFTRWGAATNPSNLDVNDSGTHTTPAEPF